VKSAIAGFFIKTDDLIFTGTPSGVGKLNKNNNLIAYIGERAVFYFMINRRSLPI